MPMTADTSREFQITALEAIARGDGLKNTLDQACRLVEQGIRGSICFVVLVDELSGELDLTAGPGASPEFVDALNSLVAFDMESSGGKALFQPEPVVVSDTTRDSRWTQLQPISSKIGIAACWSAPIFSPEDSTIGSIAVCRSQQGEPTAHEEEFLLAASNIACIAVQQHTFAETLLASEKTNRDYSRDVQEMVVSADAQSTTIVACSQTFAANLGYSREDVIGRPLLDIYDPRCHVSARRCMQAAVDNGEAPDQELQLLCKNGRLIDVNQSTSAVRDQGGTVVRIRSACRDITKRKQAEIAVRETHKLESLGAMAGSIAHEYNNLLAVIVGNADLAFVAGKLEPAVASWIADIQTAGKRATELTRQLQEFAGESIACVETIDLSALLPDMVNLLGSATSKRIEYEHENGDEASYVNGDLLQIRQVMMGLVSSAEQAIENTADTVHIRTGVFTADRTYLQQSCAGEGLPEGDYAFIDVHHSGYRLTDEELGRIGEPFFASSATGGSVTLATTLGIIRRHKGALHIDNDGTRGVTFRALFPRWILATAPAVVDTVRKGDASTATVLVVDDEAMVVTVAKEMLSDQGLRVLTAYDGEQAVSIARQHIAEIDAVVLDATMSEMSGEDTFRALRDICDDLPVVFCSGQRISYCLNLLEGKELTDFVPKPFKSSVLYQAVADLVERRNSQRRAAKNGRHSLDVAPDKSSLEDTPPKATDS